MGEKNTIAGGTERKTIPVRLPADMHQEIKLLALFTGRSVNDIITELVRAHLARSISARIRLRFFQTARATMFCAKPCRLGGNTGRNCAPIAPFPAHRRICATSFPVAFRPIVKGGVKLDHWGGEKADHFTGGRSFGLKDLRGRLECRPATRFAGRV